MSDVTHASWALAYVLQQDKRLVSPRLRKIYNAISIDRDPWERSLEPEERETLRDCAHLLRGMAHALDAAARVDSSSSPLAGHAKSAT